MQPGLLAPSTLLHQRYCIEKQVGTGDFGAVYKARDTLFSHRLVAIKEMNQGGLSPRELAEASAAFEHEALFLAGLAHPHLPRIHDQFAEQGRSYMVMDFIDGSTLEEYLEKIALRLPLEEVLDIGLQLCSALEYLHTRQPPLIFRDLKPANVMRTSDGHVYLIDFGIARHFQPGKAKDTIPLGSQGYAAPEQYGKAQTTLQTDIYGLGALLHQLVTGHDPSLTPFRFAPVRVRQSPVSGQLDALLKEMLAMEMSKRPASMTVVREHLLRLLAQQTANQLSPLQQSQSLLIKRRSFGCWIAGSLFVLTAVGSTFATSYTLQYIAARSRLTPPDTTTPPTKATPPPGTTNTLSLTVPLYTYRGHQGTVAALSWSPNGRWIASSGVLDKTVQVWEATTGNHVLTYRLHPAAVNTVAWSPDGQYIASAGQDGIVQVWPPQAIQAGQEDEIGSHPAPLSIVRYAGHGGAAVNNLAWSPDGAYIASAGEDITVQLWHSLTARHIFTYTQHSKGGAEGSLQGVTSVTWSPNGKYIASGAYDGTVQLWNASPVPAP